MVRQTREGVGVESVLRRYFHSSVQRAELVTETDAVRDLGAELKPREIEIAAKADLCKIVHEVEEHGFLAVAAHVDTHTAAGDDIRPIVAFAHSGELEIKRYRDRDTEDVNILFKLSGLASNGFAGLGDISECALGERQSGTEAQIKITAESHVGYESYGKTGHKVADACVIDVAVNLDFGVGDAKGHEVHT